MRPRFSSGATAAKFYTITSVPAALVLNTLVSNLPPFESRNLFTGAFFGVGDNFALFMFAFFAFAPLLSITSATM